MLSTLRLIPAIGLASLAVVGRNDYRPSPAELAASYKRADSMGREMSGKAFMLRLQPIWDPEGKAVYYRKDLPKNGEFAFFKVDLTTGTKAPAFDLGRLKDALEKAATTKVQADKLPFQTFRFTAPGKIAFEALGKGWNLDLTSYELKAGELPQPTRPPRNAPWRQNLWAPSREPAPAPNGSATAQIVNQNVVVKAGDKTYTIAPSTGSYYARLAWSPDSQRVIAIKVTPGDRKKVYLLQSSPDQWGPAILSERVYDRPGDKVDTFEFVLVDPTTGVAKPIDAGALDYGDMPWPRWTKDQKAFTFDRMDRGYGRWRVFKVDPLTGKSETLIDDDPETFVDSTAHVSQFLDKTDEIIYTSERDGWHHLYLSDGKGGSTQITKGEWVVRGVTSVDEDKREITFTASGINAGEDPYYIHYYRIGFDGKNLVSLTPAKGTHTIQLAPDGKTFVDTYSTVVDAPAHEVRRVADGSLVAKLETADVSEAKKAGWRAPEPFVAKGRDGKTDIYGLVYRPSNFDPKKRYPIVEDIYAGPQDSFVPKAFSVSHYDQSVAELGFIVVKIDGMGTRNRSKAFHDVCYKNLADAGFPDRILWMKALAKKEPAADIERVGIFGTSAGGQNAGGAVLFHPEFYKVAVASCGCHDNRLDKIWWNEQWMGVMGPHYAANSNITNAAKLQGKLMLMVGELDSNVPPESTYRYGDALQRAGKEFELVMITNADHTAGGPYGERKRRDFFVQNLLGVAPPFPNGN